MNLSKRRQELAAELDQVNKLAQAHRIESDKYLKRIDFLQGALALLDEQISEVQQTKPESATSNGKDSSAEALA